MKVPPIFMKVPPIFYESIPDFYENTPNSESHIATENFIPRRSERLKNKDRAHFSHIYDKNIYFIEEFQNFSFLAFEPNNFKEAMNSPDRELCTNAIDSE